MLSFFATSLLLASAAFADTQSNIFTDNFMDALYGPATANQIRGCYIGDYSNAAHTFVYDYRYAM